MAKKYTQIHNAAVAIAPVTEKIDPKQVENNAGGFVYQITPWQQLDRFLILGTESGTYYTSAVKLTKENTKNISVLIAEDGIRVINTIVDVSSNNRAPKNAPAIYALALVAATTKDVEVKKLAFEVMPKVARYTTDFFAFIQQYKELGGGFGSVAKKGLQKWYKSKNASGLAYQLVKYRQRDGWTHHDVLSLAHPKANDEQENNLYIFAKALDGKALRSAEPREGKKAPTPPKYNVALLPEVAQGYLQMQTASSAREAAQLIEKYNLPWETVPTEFLKDKIVWEAALPSMGATAMIRNLGKMTSIGLISTTSAAEKFIAEKFNDGAWLQEQKIHPMNILAAAKVYGHGQGVKGDLTWMPTQKINNALDSAFYASFKNVEPTGKNMEIALDVSGSMFGSQVSGFPFMSAAEASAAMALILITREPNCHVSGFSTRYIDLDINPKMRLDQVLRYINGLPFGGTDCALPMKNALEKGWEFDNFTIFTDNETWAGGHPSQTLVRYRKEMKRRASLIVCAMSGSNFTIADPSDPDMLDISGMDSSIPELIRNFIIR